MKQKQTSSRFIITQKGGGTRLIIIFAITTFKCDKQDIYIIAIVRASTGKNETTCVLEICYIPSRQEKKNPASENVQIVRGSKLP